MKTQLDVLFDKEFEKQMRSLERENKRAKGEDKISKQNIEDMAHDIAMDNIRDNLGNIEMKRLNKIKVK